MPKAAMSLSNTGFPPSPIPTFIKFADLKAVGIVAEAPKNDSFWGKDTLIWRATLSTVVAGP